ncbi:MAG: Ppx/GppA phosphatase family protein [Mariprofundaceae bacterium]
MSNIHASIDVGSNTLRLLIARPVPNSPNTATAQAWEIIDYRHLITRLGEGLHESGRLSDAAMERTLQALQLFKSVIDHHQVASEQLRATATAAVREAKNGTLFQQQAEKKTGIHLSIIDGEEEAKLSLLGASSVLHEETSSDMLLFDIGGGSTEFVRSKNSSAIDAISCKLGVVRLVEAHLHSDPPSTEDYLTMKKAAHDHLEMVAEHWRKISGSAPKSLVGTAGTVTTLAAVQMNLVPYDPEQVNNHQISHENFISLRNHLLNLNHEQRQNIPAIEPGRADLIIAGLAIIEAIMEKWGYKSLITVDAGLLEGNWLDSYEDKSGDTAK